MSELFLKFFNRSVSAGVLIIVVVLARILLQKSPKWIHCILWAMVAVRLLCPFPIESAFSLAPNAQAVSTENDTPEIQTGFAALDDTANRYLAKYYFEGVTVPVKESVRNPINVISYIWLCGAAVLLVYAAVSYVRISKKVRESICVGQNIFLCDRIHTPFLLGIIKPKIYLPSFLTELQAKHVVAHEKAHIRRLDYLWKPLGYVLFCVYWFQPLCWLAYLLFCRDMEMACDEQVVKNWDTERKKEYSLVLLSFHVPGKIVAASPLAFGEIGVKQRVKAVLKSKKPTFWLIAAALLSCAVIGALFLTNPKKQDTTGLSDAPQTDALETEQAQNTALEQQSDAVYREQETFVKTWADAFCDRDGAVIERLSSDSVRKNLIKEQLLMIDDGDAIFGWSSPWPMWDTSAGQTAGYVSDIEYGEKGRAVILYYAWSSDPHVTVWKEDITFEEKNGDYKVTDEQIHYFEFIASGAEFDEAYPQIDGTPMDYSVNGFGEALANNSILSSSMIYHTLSEPVSAARYLLNLLDNENKVKIEMLQADSQDSVNLKITFAEDGAERYIKMVQLENDSSIWIPKDY